jgi:DMSO/TMAO reductase YedYZ molybdopterin-dependent catalytic subunit
MSKQPAALVVLLAACLVMWPGFSRADTSHVVSVSLPDGSTIPFTQEVQERLAREQLHATARGETHEYSGHDLRAVLEAVGYKPTESLRGAAMRRVLVAEGSDGYTVTFSLAELDPSIGNRKVVLVDAMDGKPLPRDVGPWRLVVPADARPTRWVRSLRSLAVREVR